MASIVIKYLIMIKENHKAFFLRNLIWGFVFLFPTSALFLNSSFSLPIILMVLYGSKLFFDSARSREAPELRYEKIFIALGTAGIILSLLSLFATRDILNISTPELEYLEKQLRFLFFVPLLFVMKKISLPEKIIWWGASFAALSSGVYALLFSFLNPEVYRIGGGGNPIFFGCFSVISSFLALNGFHFFLRMGKSAGAIPISSFCLGMTGAVLSGSRGAWLAVPFLAIVTLVHFRRHLRVFYLWVFLASSLLITLSFIAFTDSNIITQRISEAADAVGRYFAGNETLTHSTDPGFTSIGGRLEMYRASFMVISEKPFLGAGPGGYHDKVKQYIEEGKVDDGIKEYWNPHSDYLYAAATGGISGFVIFVATVYFLPFMILLAQANKSERECPGQYEYCRLLWAGVIIISGFMVFSLTDSTLFKHIRLHYYYLLLSGVIASFNVNSLPKPDGLSETLEDLSRSGEGSCL